MINSSSKDEDIFKDVVVQYMEIEPEKLRNDRLPYQFVSFWNLYQSIKKDGIKEPLTIYKMPDGRRMCKGGQRRLWIAKHLGIKKIPIMQIEFFPSKLNIEGKRMLSTKDMKKYYTNNVSIKREKDCLILQTTPFQDGFTQPYEDTQLNESNHKLKITKGCWE